MKVANAVQLLRAHGSQVLFPNGVEWKVTWRAVLNRYELRFQESARGNVMRLAWRPEWRQAFRIHPPRGRRLTVAAFIHIATARRFQVGGFWLDVEPELPGLRMTASLLTRPGNTVVCGPYHDPTVEAMVKGLEDETTPPGVLADYLRDQCS